MEQSPGLVNFVPAVAYHFCLNLPAAFKQPGARLLAEPCRFSQCEFMQPSSNIWSFNLLVPRSPPLTRSALSPSLSIVTPDNEVLSAGGEGSHKSWTPSFLPPIVACLLPSAIMSKLVQHKTCIKVLYEDSIELWSLLSIQVGAALHTAYKEAICLIRNLPYRQVYLIDYSRFIWNSI